MIMLTRIGDVMKKYPIKKFGKDFRYINTTQIAKGTRTKRFVLDFNDKHKAFFKYEVKDRLLSEACSEKMAYEIAKILGYECAKIELAKDSNGEIGVLNYIFINDRSCEHTDALSYLNINNNNREFYYTISNIKKTLDELDSSLFLGFIKMMVFDALIGEQDRHEENWGIVQKDGSFKFSPLYDNGDSLLNFFKDNTVAEPYYNNEKNFDTYINNSKTYIYKEDNKKRYKHFELIAYLNENYHDDVQREILNLNKLTNKAIEEIVRKIPNELLTNKHRIFIIEYLEKRRDILMNIK